MMKEVLRAAINACVVTKVRLTTEQRSIIKTPSYQSHYQSNEVAKSSVLRFVREISICSYI